MRYVCGMQTPFALHGVVFDMDGLLLDSERMWADCLLAACTDLGISFDRQGCLDMIGKSAHASRLVLLERIQSEHQVDTLLGVVSERYDHEIVKRAIPLKPGVLELLSFLDDRGLPRAVATSTRHERAVRKIAAAGIGERMNFVIGGDQVSRGKPEPEIYLRACAAMGLVPTNCMAFEDSPTGLTAAHRAGLRTVLVPDLLEPPAEARSMAWRVVDSLTEIPPILSSFSKTC